MDLRVCLRCGRGEPPPAVRCSGCGQALELRDETWLVGQALGSYRIERVLGSGGMGVVFGARHQALLREAAVKVLQPGLGSHDDTDSRAEGYARRFLREARLLATLDHPGIVGIYDFDVSPFGFPYLVMPLLRGETLRALLDRHHDGLQPAWVAAILDDLAAALSHAHEHAVVHRDLKPENVFLVVSESQARARLLDFGIAHGGHKTALDRTATGVLMGTPRYLAPEQLRGDAVSAATDQYSLALVAIELLTGRSVRGGESLTEIMQRYATQPLPEDRLPADMPKARADALQRATDPQPLARFDSLAQFVEALSLPPPNRRSLAHALRIPDEAPALVSEDTLVLATPPASKGVASQQSVSPRAIGTAQSPAKGGMRRWLVLTAIIVAVAAWVVGIRPWQADGMASAPADFSTLAEHDWLRAGPSVPLAGSLEVLAQIDQTLVLRQAGGWALFDLDTNTVAPGVSLTPDETLLGVDDRARLWLMRDGQLDALDPIRGTRQRLAGAGPGLNGNETARWSMARSGRWLARIDVAHFSVLALIEGQLQAQWQGPATAQSVLALGDRSLTIASPRGQLQTWDLETGKSGWIRDLPAFRVNALALAEDIGLVAVATEDFVQIYQLDDGKPVASLPFVAHSLMWVADGPRLLASNNRQLTVWAWQDGQFQSRQTLDNGGQLFEGDAAFFSLGDGYLRRYRFGPELGSVDTGVGQVWAAVADAHHFYVGGEKPDLVRLAPKEAVLRRQVHAAGIPDLRIHQDRLISSSDDRTLAVWRLPELDLQWRAKGHDFFVNQIALGASLWSSSSDGSLRRWRWPELEPAEDIALRPRFSEPLELHALWAAPDDSELLVGTWNDRILRLQRKDSAWVLASAPFEAHTGYRMIDLPGLDAVLVVGISPGRLTVYDRRDARLSDLPRDGRTWLAAVGDGSGAGVWLGGDGALTHLALHRRDDGRFDLRSEVFVASDFRSLGALALRMASEDHTAMLMLGNEVGQAIFLPPPALGKNPQRAISDPPRDFNVQP